MKKRNKVLWSILAVLVAAVLFVVNMVSGNPISRSNAQKEYLRYFETTYGEEFTVYESSYNAKIPDYIFEIGPASDKEVRFDTALYGMGITDEYGGILAAEKLAQDVDGLLKAGFGNLGYSVTAEEDPMVGYGGEDPDYFETDPGARVTRNHYLLEVILPDGSATEAELQIIFAAMVKEIEAKLPYETPNLQVNARFQSEPPARETDSKEDRGNTVTLFSTTD